MRGELASTALHRRLDSVGLLYEAGLAAYAGFEVDYLTGGGLPRGSRRLIADG